MPSFATSNYAHCGRMLPSLKHRGGGAPGEKSGGCCGGGMTRYLAPSAVDRWRRQDVERMQGPRMTRRLAIAHHEAAHAIAVICAGRDIDSVEVDDRAAGKCFYRRGPAGEKTTEQRLRWVAGEMKIVAAGQD